MQVNIRGGTHYEFSFMPGYTASYPFGTATLRGYDLVGWYTTAWLDRYVGCTTGRCRRARRSRRLLTDRWRHDAREGAVDPTSDAQPVLLLPALSLRAPHTRANARCVRRHARRLRGHGRGRSRG